MGDAACWHSRLPAAETAATGPIPGKIGCGIPVPNGRYSHRDDSRSVPLTEQGRLPFPQPSARCLQAQQSGLLPQGTTFTGPLIRVFAMLSPGVQSGSFLTMCLQEVSTDF